MTKTVYILGGGIAGLYCAKCLREKHSQSRIIIYEQNHQLGGRCYSFSDPAFGTLDNATHVLIGANTLARQTLTDQEFDKKVYFFDLSTQKTSARLLPNIPEIALALFNTPVSQTPPALLAKTLQKLFPFTTNQTQTWFSKANLSSLLIDPLTSYATEIKQGWLLKSFQAQNQRITTLNFNQGNIELAPQDIIISCLDASGSQKIFKTPKFDFNSITNIFFKLKQPASLPELKNFLGIKNGLIQWIFAYDDILAITISNSNQIKPKERLVQQLWKEAQLIIAKPHLALPPYRIIQHQRATIRQDHRNNALRPTSAQTKFSNLLLAGDWTMKNYPSSIEAAMLSAQRAIDSISLYPDID